LSESTFIGLASIFALAVLFDYINGFHDTANAVATSVSTRALKPEHAILISATANFVGAVVLGTAVAGTIGSGIVQDRMIMGNGAAVLAAALIGAIAWNLVTWALAIPSSSSHALIGGLIGAAITAAGLDSVQWTNFATKVVLPLLMSPLLGLAIGFVVMVIILNVFRRANPARLNERFRRLQVFSAIFLALSHGSNDAQKTMGIMTLALYNAGVYTLASPTDRMIVPTWVILTAATAMCFGTAAGGWRIMKTVGQRVVKLDPVHGWAAEATAGTVILAASHFGMPVSTTHVISTAIMGVGTTDRIKAVRWGVARGIVTAWILTIPCTAAIAAATYFVLRLV
jgi:inorganic phosphate transporter, PiT family